MKNNFTHLIFLLPVVFFLSLSACSDYDGGDLLPSCTDVHWEYEGHDGPDHWGELCIDFTPCGGAVQSLSSLPGKAISLTQARSLRPLAPRS